MARNASGNYTLPAGNPVVTGTTISSTWANPTLADVATEIQDSLSRTGRGAMLAPLKHTSGSEAAPSMTFNAEPQSGWYRAAANDIRLAVNGVDALRFFDRELEIWDATNSLWYTFVNAGTVGSTIEEQTLAAMQTVVTFTKNIAGAALYVDGTSGDRGRLLLDTDYTYNAVDNEVTLTTDYPAGTILYAVVSDETDVTAAATAAAASANAAAASVSDAADQVVLASNQVTLAENQVTIATTEANRADTEADRSANEANRSATEADRSATEADRSATEADRSTTEANRAENYADVLNAPVGQVQFWANRNAIPAGYGALDGQELSRATYPDLAALVTDPAWAGLVVDDATWLADTSQRGKFSTGDGSTTFRVPDYNGKSAGAIGGVYLTGDGLKTAAENGLIRDDQMQQITGNLGLIAGSHCLLGSTADANGALQVGEFQPPGTTGRASGDAQSDRYGLDFDSANSPDARAGTYTHGVDVSGCWVIRLFGAVVSVGSADAAQLATDYANLAGEVANKLDANDALGGSSYSWVDETANRIQNVVYTNSNGVPIEVCVTASDNQSGSYSFNVDSVEIARVSNANSPALPLPSITVPPGSTYELTHDNFSGIVIWMEFKPV